MTTPTLHPAGQQTRQLIGWHVSNGGDRPGIAATKATHERLRVVVCEPLDMSSHRRYRLLTALAHHVAGSTCNLSQAVQMLLSDDAAGCASVTVTDLAPEGAMSLGGFAAPPVLHLRTDGRAELLPLGLDDVHIDRIVPGDGLVVCSPTLLEDPPKILSALRRRFHHADRLGGLSVEQVVTQLMSDLGRHPRNGVAVAVQVMGQSPPYGPM